MSIRNITLPQAIVLVACLGAVVAAYKFVGVDAAAVTVFVSTVLNFLMGREEKPQ